MASLCCLFPLILPIEFSLIFSGVSVTIVCMYCFHVDSIFPLNSPSTYCTCMFILYSFCSDNLIIFPLVQMPDINIPPTTPPYGDHPSTFCMF